MTRESKFLDRLAIVLFLLTIITRFTSGYLGIPLVPLVVVTLIFTFLLILFNKIKIGKVHHHELSLIYILVLYTPITLLWTDSPSYGFSKLSIFLPIVLTSLLIAKFILFDFKFFKIFYSFLFIFLIIITILNGAFDRIILSLNDNTRFILDEGAVNSSVSIANFFGFSLIILSSFFLEAQKTYTKLIIVFFLVTGLTFLFFTGARGPLGALVLSYLLFKLINANRIYSSIGLICFFL